MGSIAADQHQDVVSADPNPESGVYEIESLCMNCHNNGTTRILPIQIPFFKQVLLESFSCDHCGERNNSVKNAGAIQEKAVKYTFKLDSMEDFGRQVVCSDTGVFRVESLNLEMPSSPGQLTNLESLFSKIGVDLDSDQPVRKVQNLELHNALASVIQRLRSMLQGEDFPVTVTLDDISGNSFIEPSMADTGNKYSRRDYLRTHEQNVKLGLATVGDEEDMNGGVMDGVDIVDDEVYTLQSECPACSKACIVNMKKVFIPHFKEVFIIATVCDSCGYRTSDVKTGGAIPDKGKRITLQVKTREDLSRDILKSETCALNSPDLGLEVQPGTLGGRFTTVEGLLAQVRSQLHGQIFDTDNEDIAGGDSMDTEAKSKWNSFFAKLEKAMNAELEFSITLEDPLGSSYVQQLVDDDPQVVTEEYERTDEEMEELGLNDMQTEGYEKEVEQDD